MHRPIVDHAPRQCRSDPRQALQESSRRRIRIQSHRSQPLWSSSRTLFAADLFRFDGLLGCSFDDALSTLGECRIQRRVMFLIDLRFSTAEAPDDRADPDDGDQNKARGSLRVRNGGPLLEFM